MKKLILNYYVFFPLLLLCGYYTFKAVDFPIHDFANYYFGGRFLADGHFNADVYFPYHFNKAISDLGNPNIFASYAPNTPFLAVLFSPFAFLSVAKAKLVFNCFSVLIFIFSIYRLFAHYKLNPKYALLIPILFLVPIKNNLLFGQVYFLLFFLLSEGWLANEKKQLKSMAFFWSFAILLKVFPVLIVLLFVFKKQWKALFYLTSFCLLFFSLSLFFTGIEVWGFYFNTVLPKASNGEIATSFVDNYQSVFMFLKRFIIYETIENPHPFFHAASWFVAAVFAFKIGVLTLGYFVSKKNSNTLFVLAYWILAMILLSPYGSTYTFVLLLFPFFALLKSNLSNVKKVLCYLILFLINTLPLSLFIDNAFPFSYIRLFLLIAFSVFFIVSLFQKSVLLKAFVFGCIAFVLATFLKPPIPQKDEGLLTAGSPILIYDYQIKGNQIIYFYWTERGEDKATVSLKSLGVDSKTSIYLSDEGRGIGFYTLRKAKNH